MTTAGAPPTTARYRHSWCCPSAAAPHGYHYAPDPSSQQICSIGGNVAENSGGAHCLKDGFTANHVTGLAVVTPDGELVRLGGAALDPPGYDLLGAFVGSEGTLGIGAGLVPAAIGMMDAPAIEAAEAAVHCGYPPGAGAVLIVELDGPGATVDADFERVLALCRDHGAFEVRVAVDDAERALIRRGRKSAFAAVGRISPDYIVGDGVIPRTALPAVLRAIEAMAAERDVRVANVFHAGDGDLHPLVLFDAAVPGATARAEEVCAAILDLCVASGGSITGEHGVGVDKMAAMR